MNLRDFATKTVTVPKSEFDRLLPQQQAQQEDDSVAKRVRDFDAIAPRAESYKQSVEKWAAEYGVDRDLLYGSIAQETSFRPQAESVAGASGITQMMPKTAIGVASNLGDEEVAGMSNAEVKQHLKDSPDKAIRFGAAYYKELLDTFDGDKTKAIAAYNAGPTAVWRALERGGDQWQNYLPNETKDYVKIVSQFSDKFRETNKPKIDLMSLAKGSGQQQTAMPTAGEKTQGPQPTQGNPGVPTVVSMEVKGSSGKNPLDVVPALQKQTEKPLAATASKAAKTSLMKEIAQYAENNLQGPRSFLAAAPGIINSTWTFPLRVLGAAGAGWTAFTAGASEQDIKQALIDGYNGERDQLTKLAAYVAKSDEAAGNMIRGEIDTPAKEMANEWGNRIAEAASVLAPGIGVGKIVSNGSELERTMQIASKNMIKQAPETQRVLEEIAPTPKEIETAKSSLTKPPEVPLSEKEQAIRDAIQRDADEITRRSIDEIRARLNGDPIPEPKQTKFGDVSIAPEQMDKLTSLPNSSVTKTYLEKVPEDEWIASIDGDHFKAVNDTQGHQAGDDVITKIGEEIRKHFPDVFAGREGGEEFAISLGKDLTQEKITKLNELLNNISQNIRINGDPFTLSIGVGRGRSVTQKGELRLNSDVAAYLAKDKGRNQIAIDFGDRIEYTKGSEIGKKQYVVDHAKKQFDTYGNILADSGDVDAGTADAIRDIGRRIKEGKANRGPGVPEQDVASELRTADQTSLDIPASNGGGRSGQPGGSELDQEVSQGDWAAFKEREIADSRPATEYDDWFAGLPEDQQKIEFDRFETARTADDAKISRQEADARIAKESNSTTASEIQKSINGLLADLRKKITSKQQQGILAGDLKGDLTPESRAVLNNQADYMNENLEDSISRYGNDYLNQHGMFDADGIRQMIQQEAERNSSLGKKLGPRPKKNPEDEAPSVDQQFTGETGDLFAGTDFAKSEAQSQKDIAGQQIRKDIQDKIEEKKGGAADTEGLPLFPQKQQDLFDESSTRPSGAKQDEPDIESLFGEGDTEKPLGRANPNNDRNWKVSPEDVRADKKAKPVSTTEVISELSKLGNVPVRYGKFTQDALGIYKPKEHVARIADAGDIRTATHEVGHAIERVVIDGMKSSPDWSTMKTELIAAGKELYGPKGEKLGTGRMVKEGWAEFTNDFFTNPSVLPKKYGKVADFFENQFLPNNPEFAKQVSGVRSLTQAYSDQGAMNRVAANIDKGKGRIGKAMEDFRKGLSEIPDVTWEELAPLDRFTKAVTEIRANKSADIRTQIDNAAKEFAAKYGKIQTTDPARYAKLKAKFDSKVSDLKAKMDDISRPITMNEDPYLTASSLRQTAVARAKYFFENGVTDLAGNVVAKPLSAAAKVVGNTKGARDKFTLYLYGRRALERWSKGKNPGISKEDAQKIVDDLGSKEYEEAADIVYRFQDAVLDYAAEAGAIPKKVREAIRKESQDYIPLNRVFEEISAGKVTKDQRRGYRIAYRQKGSGRRVVDPFQSIIKNTENTLAKAQQQMVVNAVLKHKDLPDIGKYLEKVPQDLQPTTIPVDQIKSQLAEIGVDISDDVDLSQTLTMFTPVTTPRGKDPIFANVEDGKVKWYHMDKDLFDALNSMNQVVKLPKVIDWVAGKPARMMRMGTTGLRAAFTTVNFLRDLPTALIQRERGGRSSLQFVADVGRETVNKYKAIFNGHESEWNDLFLRLGGEMAQPLGADAAVTRNAAKEIFESRGKKLITHPISTIRDLIQVVEGAPRVAELKSVAQKLGVKPSDKLTVDQMLQMTLALKRVTTDFSARGKAFKYINPVVPFSNATVQGARTFLRTLKKKPLAAVAGAFGTFTVPTIANWLANKDEDWYKEIPFKDKLVYWHVDIGGDRVLRIPKPFEWGVAFSTIVEGALQSAHEKDPKELNKALKAGLDQVVPDMWPTTARVAWEEASNKNMFFEKPIVPRSQLDNPPEEQYGEYTSRLAKFLGGKLKFSPRRIDHIIQGIGGGLATDIVNVDRIGDEIKGRELADLPVVGRLFRRGGKYTASAQSINDFYEDYSHWVQEYNSDEPKRKAAAKGMYKLARETHLSIKALQDVLKDEKDPEKKKQIAIEMVRMARSANRYLDK